MPRHNGRAGAGPLQHARLRMGGGEGWCCRPFLSEKGGGAGRPGCLCTGAPRGRHARPACMHQCAAGRTCRSCMPQHGCSTANAQALVNSMQACTQTYRCSLGKCVLQRTQEHGHIGPHMHPTHVRMYRKYMHDAPLEAAPAPCPMTQLPTCPTWRGVQHPLACDVRCHSQRMARNAATVWR